MKSNHPAFYYLMGALGVALALGVSCITVRQSGAHDITVHTQGKGNSFTVHTERAASAQSAEATPIVDVKPSTELTVPVVP